MAAIAAVIAAAAHADAQTPTLDRVDSLLVAGQYAAAAETLEQWWSVRDAFQVPGSDRPRALMLRARLAPEPAAAEPHYLALVLGYPTSPQAPEALLRLGQGLLAAGEATRAAAYLQRLVTDYPGRAERGYGLLWLARAQLASRRGADACAAAREGLAAARDDDLTTMLRAEEAAACGLAAEHDEASPAGRPVAVAPTDADPRPAERLADPRPADGVGRFTVQTGAFRQQRSVDEIVARLRRAGHEPRVVLVPANDLIRVRVGRFEAVDDAHRLLDRLRSQGFDAVIVGDANQERRP